MRKPKRGQKRQIARMAAQADADIDLSEMPVVVDWSGAEVGRFSRPAKKPVTMRLDADVVDWLKKLRERVPDAGECAAAACDGSACGSGGRLEGRSASLLRNSAEGLRQQRASNWGLGPLVFAEPLTF